MQAATHECLLVGEAPNAAGRGRMANTTASGRRIADLGGSAIPRTNVIQRFPGRSGKGAQFPVDEARAGLARLRKRSPRRVAWIYMGKRVAAADGWRGEYLQWGSHRGRLVCTFPHPSGINMWWNDPANADAARRFIAGVAGGARPEYATSTDPKEQTVTIEELSREAEMSVAECRSAVRVLRDAKVRRSLPTCGGCGQILGFCLDTCEARGQADEAETGSNTRRWTDEELGELLRSMGGAVSRKAYAAERRRRGGVMPAESSIMRRFGSWDSFTTQCLGAQA